MVFRSADASGLHQRRLHEAIIKWQTGKLPLPESPDTYLPRVRDEHQIGCFSVDEASVLRLSRLP